MKIQQWQILILCFLSHPLLLMGQTMYSKYGDTPSAYGQDNTGARSTNKGTPVSNYQQLRDFQKSETDRIIAQKLEKQTQTPGREMKEIEVQVKLARLKLEEQNDDIKKKELEQRAEKKELQQQMLLKYIKQLHKQGADTDKGLPQSAGKTPLPTPTPEKKSKVLQEAMKAEPPN